MVTELGQLVVDALSQYSSITVGGAVVFLVSFFGWLVTRSTESLVVFLMGLGYAALPYLPNA